MPLRTIREDAHGLYIRSGYYSPDDRTAKPFRPGPIMHHPTMPSDDGGLKKGDKVEARFIGQTTLIRITLKDGRVVHWTSWMREGGDFPESK
jgi:hypothetical protein